MINKTGEIYRIRDIGYADISKFELDITDSEIVKLGLKISKKVI